MEQEQEGGLGSGAGDLSPAEPRAPGAAGEDAQAPSPVAALGPWLLLFPLVFLALAFVWIAGRREAPPRAPRAPGQDVLSVAGWSGELELGGARLVARLAPLHAAPQRQAFERRALAARYGLGAGEPFQLSLSLGAADGDGALELDLEGPWVQDREGARLVPLAAEQRPAGKPADPLRALLAPPERGLVPGRSVHLLLWGPTPGPEARLRGVARVDGAPTPFELLLETRPLGLGMGEGILARTDAPPLAPPRPRPRPSLREPTPPSDAAWEDADPLDVSRPSAPADPLEEPISGVDDEDL